MFFGEGGIYTKEPNEFLFHLLTTVYFPLQQMHHRNHGHKKVAPKIGFSRAHYHDKKHEDRIITVRHVSNRAKYQNIACNR
jgi:hypothetical protein